MTESQLPSPAQETRALSPIEAFRSTLSAMQSQFVDALPPQIQPQKFIRTLLTTLQMNPDLLSADKRSLMGSVMKAAQDGLLIDGREAAIVVFRGKSGPMAQYLPMIGGLLKKARNSGDIATLSVHVAFEFDEFDYALGDMEYIRHKPKMGDRGKPIAAYAIGRTKDGGVYREVMSVADIDKVRQSSRAKDAGPWVSWWDRMAEKTVLKRVLRLMPSSTDLDELLRRDAELENEAAEPAERQSTVEVTDPLQSIKRSMGISEVPPDAAPESTGGDA